MEVFLNGVSNMDKKKESAEQHFVHQQIPLPD